MPKRTRACLDCGEDITRRHHNARRCEPCAACREHARQKSGAGSHAPCRVNDDECRLGPVTRGYCRKHYHRMQRYGSTSLPRIHPLTRYVVNDSTGCWEWAGPLHTNGYGSSPRSTGNVQAHRMFYEQHVGPIPDGLVLDHLCRNIVCVNPEHLEPVTHQVNVQRGWDAVLAGRCRNDKHDVLEESDWYVVPGTGTRQCRQCIYERNRINKRAYRARLRAKRMAQPPSP